MEVFMEDFLVCESKKFGKGSREMCESQPCAKLGKMTLGGKGRHSPWTFNVWMRD